MARKYNLTHIYDTDAEAQSARKLLSDKFGSSIEKINIIPAPYGFILQVDTQEISDNQFEDIKAEIEPRSRPKVSKKPEPEPARKPPEPKPEPEPAKKPPEPKPEEKPPEKKPKPKPEKKPKEKKPKPAEKPPEPKPPKEERPVSPVQKTPEPRGQKSRSVAIILAVFFGLWSWLYTYQRDKLKFWINLVVALITLGFWGFVSWIWAIIDAAAKPASYYSGYPAVKQVYPKKAYVFIGLGGIITLIVVIPLIGSILGTPDGDNGYVTPGTSIPVPPTTRPVVSSSSDLTVSSKYVSLASPSIDGVLLSDEWPESAVDKTYSYDSNNGEKTVLMKAYFMNDEGYLYIAVTVTSEDLTPEALEKDQLLLALDIFFDENDDGILRKGEDNKKFWELQYQDGHQMQESKPYSTRFDTTQNGEGVCVFSNTSNTYVYECRIPLNSGDPEDLAVKPGDIVGIRVILAEYKLKDDNQTWRTVSQDGWPGGPGWINGPYGHLSLATKQPLVQSTPTPIPEPTPTSSPPPTPSPTPAPTPTPPPIPQPTGTTPYVLTSVKVGSYPIAVGVNPNTNRIYVVNYKSDTVSVIDGLTSTVLDTIYVGRAPVDIGVNAATNRIYVINRESNDVSVINGDTNSIMTTISLTEKPNCIGVNPRTNRIYVGYTTNRISIINGISNELLGDVEGYPGHTPSGIAANIITNRIYVTNLASDDVSVINGSTDRALEKVRVGSFPDAIGINPDTNFIYVANYEGNNVSVIDGTSDRIFITADVGNSPLGLGVNPGTDRVYVANYEDNNVSVMDGTTGTILTTLEVEKGPLGVGVNIITNRIYVANSASNTVSVIGYGVSIPTPSPSPTPTSTTLPILFEDDFSDPGSGWYVSSDERQEKAYEDGEYSLLSKLPNTIVWQWIPRPTWIEGDFTVEVDIRRLSTDKGHSGGIAFRYQDNDNYYIYEVRSGDNQYRLLKQLRNKWITLKGWTYSGYINTGVNTNHLKVACSGTQIEIYVNGHKLGTFNDSSFISGKILLTTDALEIPGSHYHFDNFKLYAGTEN